MKSKLIILFFTFHSSLFILRAQDPLLTFDSTTCAYLTGLRSWDSATLIQKRQWFEPIPVAGGKFILPPQLLVNPFYEELTDSLYSPVVQAQAGNAGAGKSRRTVTGADTLNYWIDSIAIAVIPDSLLIISGNSNGH